jgi:hypothetical protein
MDDLNHYEMSIPRHIDMTTMSMEEVPPEEVATLLLLVSSTVSIFIDIAACWLLPHYFVAVIIKGVCIHSI